MDHPEQAGFSVPEGTNILAAECKEVEKRTFNFLKNFLQWCYPVLKSESREDGIEKSSSNG